MALIKPRRYRRMCSPVLSIACVLSQSPWEREKKRYPKRNRPCARNCGWMWMLEAELRGPSGIHREGKIGFMQGRLSPVIGGRIQTFPWSSWKDEFAIAAKHGFHLMEWTLDQDGIYENPLLTSVGQTEIRALCKRHD